MKAIHNKVNIVPVIAKADTLTLKERERLKRRVSAGCSCVRAGARAPQRSRAESSVVWARRRGRRWNS